MAVKIARGTTGQADYLGQGCDDPPHAIPMIYNGSETYYHGGPEVPGEWYLSPAGTVTVPVDAPTGIYGASYGRSEYCEYNGEPDMGNVIDYYEFEVVCMSITITGLS